MVTFAAKKPVRENDYPTSDGRPMAETDIHRQLMMALIEALEDRYASDPNVYVSGNLLLFYEEGNKRKHVSPDTFVVFGVPKRLRINYLVWEEGKGPNIAIELTSSSTKNEDTRKKFALYQDVLRVPEYFMFDPFDDYLKPRIQGYRLVGGKYRPMKLKEGRLYSKQLNLFLEPHSKHLRFVDPETGLRIPTRSEARAAEQHARERAEAEVDRLRAELAAMRQRPDSRNGH